MSFKFDASDGEECGPFYCALSISNTHDNHENVQLIVSLAVVFSNEFAVAKTTLLS